MSSTFDRSISLPCLANWAMAPGPGNPARSGGFPAETRVVSTALRSRVPSYCIFAPEASSQGLTSDMNVACSSPPQVASTLTVPPTFWICGAAAGTGEPAAVAVPVVPAVLVPVVPAVLVVPAVDVPVVPAVDVPVVPAVPVPVVPAVVVPAAAGVLVPTPGAPAAGAPVGRPAAATAVPDVGAPLVVVPTAPATGVVAVVVADEPDEPTGPVAAALVARAAVVGLAAAPPPPHAWSSGTASKPTPMPSTERRVNGRSTNRASSRILRLSPGAPACPYAGRWGGQPAGRRAPCPHNRCQRPGCRLPARRATMAPRARRPGMANTRATSREYLRYQYADSEKLRIRADAHRLYSERPNDWQEWVLARLAP